MKKIRASANFQSNLFRPIHLKIIKVTKIKAIKKAITITILPLMGINYLTLLLFYNPSQKRERKNSIANSESSLK